MTPGLECFALKLTPLCEPFLCVTSSPALCNGAKGQEPWMEVGGGWAGRMLRAGCGTGTTACPAGLRPSRGSRWLQKCWAWQRCLLSAASASHHSLTLPELWEANYQFTEPAPAQTGPSKGWEPFCGLFCFGVVWFFFYALLKKWKQKDPYFKVKYIIVSNRNFRHCLFLWAGMAVSITLATRWQTGDTITRHLHLNTFSLNKNLRGFFVLFYRRTFGGFLVGEFSWFSPCECLMLRLLWQWKL